MNTDTSQRERIEYLEAENAELKRLLGYNGQDGFVDKARVVLGVQHGDALILHAFVRGHSGRREALLNVLSNGADDGPEPRVVDVRICRLRAALKPHGIEIQTLWGSGYSMSAEAKAKVEALLS